MRAFRSVIGAALCVTAVVGATSASASTSTTYYLVGDTKPFGSLSTSSPPNIPLPNFDPERDNDPGLYLDQTDKGMAETNEKKFQQWSIGAAGLQTSGAVSFRVWAAAKDLDDDRDQVLDAYLLDCAGSACTVLDQKRLAFTSSTNWSQLDFTFASMSHTFASGRSLAIRVIVPNESQDDMWLAYATASYPARVTVPLGASTTTTTTGPTTTSTTSATTTSTTSAPTTTTTAATTTTKPSSGSTTSSSSTSTSLGETTTTTPSASETTVDSQGAPITPPTTTTLPPADARPVDTAREKTTLVVSAAAEGMTTGLVNDTDRGTISPQEGLMVSFFSAAEAVKSQILASVALGILGAALLLLAMRRRRGDEEEAKALA